MEEILYKLGIIEYRNGKYQFVSCEAQDESWVQVILDNNGCSMIISLNSGETIINGVVQETQRQLIETLNAQA